MIQPSDLFAFEQDADQNVARHGEGLVMLHVLQGFVDAGAVGAIVTEHLLDRFTVQRVASFDIDLMLDYRARRPVMTFDQSAWVSYQDPELVLDLLTDDQGQAFLLLHGMEPDLYWERYVKAVRSIIERWNISMVVATHGVPMAVPHTRPVGMSVHGTRPELVGENPTVIGRAEVPAALSSLTELRLGRAGHDSLGFAVHVPHYLARSQYHPAAKRSLEAIADAIGSDLGEEELQEMADADLARVYQEVTESPEVAELVSALERQYDAFLEGLEKPSLLADEKDLPSADELGAQFEQFLAEQYDDGQN